MPPPGGLVGMYRCASSGDRRDAIQSRVLLREQDRWIGQAAVRIGDASVALAPGHLDRLDLRVEAPFGRPVEPRQDVERHERGDALRVRRDRGDLDAVIGRGDRIDPVPSVAGDVLGAHDPTGGGDRAGDLLADRAAVVGLSAAIGQGGAASRRAAAGGSVVPAPPAAPKTARAASSKVGSAAAIERALMAVSS